MDSQMTSVRTNRTATAQVLAVIGLAIGLALVFALPPASRAAGSGARRPTVSTGAYDHVTGTSAALEGTVNPHTLTTTYVFEYGPTTAYGQMTATGTLEGGSSAIDAVKVSETATGIQPGWHYRLAATNSAGPPKQGRDHLFVVKTKKTTKKDAFVLPKTFVATALDGTFVLSGTLTGTGNAGREVVLEATPYPYRAPYTKIGAPTLTGLAGGFSFRVPEMTTSTRFRVTTVTPPLIVSDVVPEQVTVRVVLKVRALGHGNGLVRFYGTVTPAEAGARVFFQLEKTPKARAPKPGKPEKTGKEKPEASERAPSFATKFDAIVKHATKSISRFSVVVKVRDSGSYRAFVEVRPGPVASGTSTSVTVHAPATKAKHKKKG
jgi:hypothetical protein